MSSASWRPRAAVNSGDRIEGGPAISRIVPWLGRNQVPIFRNNLTVLIVDGDSLTRRIHTMILDSLNLNSREVETGREATELISGGAHFDLIIMDMDLPFMTGPQTSRMLRAMGIRSKIVGVSGRLGNMEMIIFMHSGIDALFGKPMTRSEIVSILREIDNTRR